jgi:hypothetical protein
MSTDRSNNLSYTSALAASAPAFAAKAVLGDLPKGAIEHAVESKLSKRKLPILKGLKQGVAGRGSGRAIGAGIGILSAPVFLKGIQLAQSKDSDERKRGFALIGASSSVYAGQKGAIEGYRASKVSGKSTRSAAIKGLGLGSMRVGYKLPAALAMGAALAHGQKKKNKKDMYLSSALGGAAVGGASRGGEKLVGSLASQGKKGVSFHKAVAKALKVTGPAVAGGLAGGAVGGLALSGVISAARNAMKKKTASVAELAALPFVHQSTKGLMRGGTASRVLDFIPGGRGAKNLVDEARARQLAVGIREGVAGNENLGFRGAAALGFTMPELRINRQAGQQLGKLLRGVPEKRRAEVLSNLSGKIANNPKLTYTAKGDPTPILSSFDRGTRMALGKEDLYQKSNNKFVRKYVEPAYKEVMYRGRGVLDSNGLPKGYHARKRQGAIGKYGPDALTAAMGGGLMASGLPGSTAMGAHGLLGGIKGLGQHLPAFKRMGKDMVAEGIKDAVMPGLAGSPASRAKRVAMETLISPASQSGANLSGAIIRSGLAGAASSGISKPGKRKAMKMLSGKRGNLAAGLGAPTALGLTAGHLAGTNRKKKSRKKR